MLNPLLNEFNLRILSIEVDVCEMLSRTIKINEKKREIEREKREEKICSSILILTLTRWKTNETFSMYNKEIMTHLELQ